VREAPIRVLIADDHPVVRQGLRTFLGVQDDIQVVGEAADAARTVALAEELKPDIVLLDLNMPGGGGLPALAEIRARDLPSRVLVLTSMTERGHVVLAVRAGAAGYLYKDVDPQALVQAIRAVHDGNVLFAREAADAVLRGDGTPGDGPAIERLTEREREVLVQIARVLNPFHPVRRSLRKARTRLCGPVVRPGGPTCLAGRDCSTDRPEQGRQQDEKGSLVVSEKTVKTHVSNLLLKLGVQDRTQAALYAVRHGLG
jgi:DNA-binding NarL/FixJ family response regulator